MLKGINDSHVVEKSKEAAAIAIELHLSELAGKITDELNEISKNHADGRLSYYYDPI